MKNTLSDISLPKLAILIAIRDRETSLLYNCLKSLANQTFQDFEVHLADSGSKPFYCQTYQNICQQFAFVRYYSLKTRGHWWNKSYALNFLLKQVQAELIMVLDADLMLHPNFLAQLIDAYSIDKLLKIRVLRLNKEFEDYQNLFNYSPKKIKESELSGEFATGNILISRDKIMATGGYDEFYRFWGAEDKDMIMRLETQEVVSEFVLFENTPVFHQWHPKLSENLPKGWQMVIDEHFKQNVHSFSQAQISIKNQTYLSDKFDERPILQHFSNPTLRNIVDFTFDYPKEKAWTDFFKVFNDLPTGVVLSIKQDFELIPLNQDSRLGKWIRKMNQWFQYVKLSYRWVEIKTYETEVINIQEVRDFIFYFTLNFERQILDYFFEIEGKTLTFLVIKS